MKVKQNQILLIAAAGILLALFSANILHLSLNPLVPSVYVWQSGEGTVALNSYQGGGSGTSFSSDFNVGDTATLTASPAQGWSFAGWLINGATVSANPYSFTVNTDTNAKALFADGGGEVPTDPSIWNIIVEFATKNWLLILGLFALITIMLGWVKI
jgi:hypothetical protein